MVDTGQQEKKYLQARYAQHGEIPKSSATTLIL